MKHVLLLLGFLLNISATPIKQEYIDLEDGAYTWAEKRGILISECPIWNPPKIVPTSPDKREQLGNMPH